MSYFDCDAIINSENNQSKKAICILKISLFIFLYCGVTCLNIFAPVLYPYFIQFVPLVKPRLSLSLSGVFVGEIWGYWFLAVLLGVKSVLDGGWRGAGISSSMPLWKPKKVNPLQLKREEHKCQHLRNNQRHG